MKVFKATQARAEFQDVIDTAYYKEEPVIIIKRNKPWVVITKLDQTNEEIQAEIEKFLSEEKIQKLLNEK
ncbi:MAG: type II toxin-antitoxin system Phd/YefM family antitoxin [Candidatus Pacebacteria bacterium]|nr:type II toxin-antitoxin system Phd/YefM family antitoxin [Candidatus Paceibacterota bacterium]